MAKALLLAMYLNSGFSYSCKGCMHEYDKMHTLCMLPIDYMYSYILLGNSLVVV